jgi:hypothetical protein
MGVVVGKGEEEIVLPVVPTLTCAGIASLGGHAEAKVQT